MRSRILLCFLSNLMWMAAPSAAHAMTRHVPQGGDLQAAINDAQPGDVITLEPNATYVGNFMLPNKGAIADYITIRSAALDASLPEAGMRMTPAYAAFLPKIKSPNSTSALRTATAANHWKLMFLEFQANLNGYGDIIALGAGDKTQTQLSQVPYALVLDRVYVHGDPVLGQKRGISLHSRDTDIVNSWVSDCKAVSQEAQAISGFNGPGNYLIENNYLEGSTQNVLLGGADPVITDLVTSNITFRYNHLRKPLEWGAAIIAAPTGVAAAAAPDAGSLTTGTYSYQVQARAPAGQVVMAMSDLVEVSATIPAGQTGAVTISWKAVAGAQDYIVWGRASGSQTMNWKTAGLSFTDTGAAGTSENKTSGTKWLVKNIWELKNAQHAIVEGNVFENNWVAGQPGYAILFTPRNQYGTAPWVVVQDVMFQYNIVRHTAGAVNILGIDNNYPSQITNNLNVNNNVFDDINRDPWGKAMTLQVGAGPTHVTFDHNTIFMNQSTLLSFYGTPALSFQFTNNLAAHKTYGINGSDSSPGQAALDKYAPGSNVCANVFAADKPKPYPPCNYFPTETAWLAGFNDLAKGDYHVRPEFTLMYPSTDGPDLGADIGIVTQKTAIALSGDNRPRSVKIPMTTLPNGMWNQAYSQQLTCTGGSPACGWRLVATSQPPPGISFDTQTGTVVGTPTAVQSGSLTVEAYDLSNPSIAAQKSFDLVIDAPPLAVTFPAVARGHVGEPYQLTPAVTGAVSSTVWSLASNDSLPDGLDLDVASGTLAGVPTKPGSWTFTVQVQDSVTGYDRPASQPVTIAIDKAPIVISPTTLPNARYHTMYSANLNAIGGLAPFTWTAAGPLPAGLTVNPSGTISGVPETAGHFSVGISAADAEGTAAIATFALTIDAPDFTVVVPALLTATVGQAFRFTPTAIGNLGAVVWSLASGTLPTGVTVDAPSGTIAGVPTTPGPFSVVLQAQDSFDPARRVAIAGTTTIQVAVASPRASDIVLYAADATVTGSGWSLVDDTTAAAGRRIANPNLAAAKLAAPLAAPASYFELTFQAQAGVAYHLWMRGKADKNQWANDSVYVQFSGSVDANGAPLFRIGSPAGTPLSIEEGTAAGLSGWGWADDLYGGVAKPIYFATTGAQTIRVQVREDGVSIDQIVLGADLYATIAPGATKDDATILPRAGATFRNIVLYTAVAAVNGTWSIVDDATAAGGRRVTNPDAGAAKLTVPLASPANYFELTFTAEAGLPYHLWLRGKAYKNQWANDSVYVQFSGTVDATGAPINRIGSTSAASVSVEDASGAGLSEWGWADDSYGGIASPISFATTGRQTIRVQVREDGASFDQIVISADRYFTTAPGTTKNDVTIVPR